MKFRYNSEKNALLLKERNIGFDEIIQAIERGNILDIRDHPNKNKYPNQAILYVRVVDEVYAVPFIEEDEHQIFLKTLYPSRKARKEFLAE